MRNKYITLVAGIAIVVGLILCTSTFFVANGKIGVWVTSNGIRYPYDPTLHIKESVELKDIKNLIVDGGDLSVVTEEIAGETLKISYEYLGDSEELVIKQDGNTAKVTKEEGTMKWAQVDFRFLHEEDNISPMLKIGIPKGMIFETLSISDGYMTNGQITLQGIEITKELLLASGQGGVQINDSKIANMTIEGNQFVTMQNVVMSGTLETRDSVSGDFFLENVKAKNIALASSGYQLNLKDVTVSEKIVLQKNDGEIILDNVQAATWDFSEVTSEIQMMHMDISSDILLSGIEQLHITDSTLHNLSVNFEGYGTGILRLERVNFSGNFMASNLDGISALLEVQAKEMSIQYMNDSLVLDKITLDSLILIDIQGDLFIDNSNIGNTEIDTESSVVILNTEIKQDAKIHARYALEIKDSKLSSADFISETDAIILTNTSLQSGKLAAYNVILDGNIGQNLYIDASDTVQIKYPKGTSMHANILLKTETGTLQLFALPLDDLQMYEKETASNDKLEITAGGNISIIHAV